MSFNRTIRISDDQLRLIKKALEVASERDALTDEEQEEAGMLVRCIDDCVTSPDDPMLFGFCL